MAIAAIPELSIFIVFPLRALHGRNFVADPHPLGVPANDCGALHDEIAALGFRLHPVKRFIGRAAQSSGFILTTGFRMGTRSPVREDGTLRSQAGRSIFYTRADSSRPDANRTTCGPAGV